MCDVTNYACPNDYTGERADCNLANMRIFWPRDGENVVAQSGGIELGIDKPTSTKAGDEGERSAFVLIVFVPLYPADQWGSRTVDSEPVRQEVSPVPCRTVVLSPFCPL